jgi:hypothetical protein
MPSPKAIGGITASTWFQFQALRYYCNSHGQQASNQTCPSHALLRVKLFTLRRIFIFAPLYLHSIEFLSYDRLLRLSLQKSGKRCATRPFFGCGCGGSLTQTVTLCSAISNLRSSTSTIEDRNTGGRSMSIGSRLCTSMATKSRRAAGTDRL